MGFLSDVDAGLSAESKFISSRYFYDAEGDRIFQSIMRMPEYYLTNCEHEILSMQAAEILAKAKLGNAPFDLLEFGAGDGTKTQLLIAQLLTLGLKFRYLPIDISGDVLDELTAKMHIKFPTLPVHPVNEEYFVALNQLSHDTNIPKLVLFLGSSIGNFNEARTASFMNELRDGLKHGDKLLIGFDLQKNPLTILQAYNDPTGITKAFNLNLLSRMNRELGADFALHNWDHYPTYDPATGYARSYLVSIPQQTVHFTSLNKSFHFEAGETIHTEVSRKYTHAQIEAILSEAGFSLVEHFHDCKHYYSLTLSQLV